MSKLCAVCNETTNSKYSFPCGTGKGGKDMMFIICDRCMGKIIIRLTPNNPPNNLFE